MVILPSQEKQLALKYTDDEKQDIKCLLHNMCSDT